MILSSLKDNNYDKSYQNEMYVITDFLQFNMLLSSIKKSKHIKLMAFDLLGFISAVGD